MGTTLGQERKFKGLDKIKIQGPQPRVKVTSV